jgi:tetratricopeptide (TPR) repeat protein
MVLEARGEWDAAEAVYDAILAKAPSHEGAHKRKIAMLRCVIRVHAARLGGSHAAACVRRSRGKLALAAAALVEYLDTFQADADAWLELADVYTCLGLYRQAAFCWQELVAAAPGAGPWHCAYAQVLATLGDADALRLAQKHYAAAVELSDGRDARALYGAVAAAGALQRLQATAKKGDPAPPPKGAADEMAALAAQRLEQLYAAHAPDKAPFAAAAIAAVGPTQAK